MARQSSTPYALLEQLELIEPGNEFSGTPPRVTSSSGATYFVKCGTPAEHEQYVGEAESLKAIEAAAPDLAPRIIRVGVVNGNRPFFISEFKDIHRLGDDAASALATRLATELHAKSSEEGFGFHVPTYCGVTRLKNGWFESWNECFDSMVCDLGVQLREKGSHEELCNLVDQVRRRVIPKLLGPLKIRPALLHGDLWSGNVGVDASRRPVIFDPSSFYGHNEADLAISRIFGGFSRTFFDTYHELRPKSEPVGEYPYRCDLYELFHYLNHTLIFGTSYERSAKQKIFKLLDWAGIN